MSAYGVYSVHEFAGMMDDLPEAAQTVVQELQYGSGGNRQTPATIATGARMGEEEVYNALAVLEGEGMVRSRPEQGTDERVYWLNVEDTR